MNAKSKMSYMVLGASLMLLGMAFTMMSPLTAHRAKFDEIECTKLTVVGNEGESLVEIGLGVNKDGGEIEVRSTDGRTLVALGVAECVANEFHHGGYVVVRGKSVEGIKGTRGQVFISTYRYDGGGVVEIKKGHENRDEPDHLATLTEKGVWTGRHHYDP